MKLINYYIKSDGTIHIDTTNSFGLDIYPINFKIINKISEKIIWEVEMIQDMWAVSHRFTEDCKVVITDKNNNILVEREIDNFIDGDVVQNYFDIWSSNRKGALGIVAGAHDGTTGEWVDVVNKKN